MKFSDQDIFILMTGSMEMCQLKAKLKIIGLHPISVSRKSQDLKVSKPKLAQGVALRYLFALHSLLYRYRQHPEVKDREERTDHKERKGKAAAMDAK